MAVPHSQLAAETNLFNSGQVNDFYTRNLPGYSANRTQQSGIIGQQLAGQVPGDVVNQIIQQAAERGISTGLSGSPNESAALLRALGLSSIGQQQAGMENLDRSIQQTPVPELFAPQSLFVPEMLAGQELRAARAGRSSVGSIPTANQQGYGARSIDLSGVGRGVPQYTASFNPWNNGSGAMNTPVIGGYSGGGGGSFFGGAGASYPTPAAQSSWDSWNASMPWNNSASGAATGTSWLGGGDQGPTQPGYTYMGANQPSMTDEQWEDTFWY